MVETIENNNQDSVLHAQLDELARYMLYVNRSNLANLVWEAARHIPTKPLVLPLLKWLTDQALNQSGDEIAPRLREKILDDQMDRLKRFRDWRASINRPDGTIDVSGFRPWLQEVQGIAHAGLFNAYEPLSCLLLPEKADNTLEYKATYIHGVNLRGLHSPNSNSNPQYEKATAYEFQWPELTETEYPRAALVAHAHPMKAPINVSDAAYLLVSPVDLGLLVYAHPIIYTVFSTEKTPLVDVHDMIHDLADNRPVLPFEKYAEVLQERQRAITNGTSSSSNSLNFFRQWRDTQSFCEKYAIDLYAGEISPGELILQPADKINLQWY